MPVSAYVVVLDQLGGPGVVERVSHGVVHGQDAILESLVIFQIGDRKTLSDCVINRDRAALGVEVREIGEPGSHFLSPLRIVAEHIGCELLGHEKLRSLLRMLAFGYEAWYQCTEERHPGTDVLGILALPSRHLELVEYGLAWRRPEAFGGCHGKLRVDWSERE